METPAKLFCNSPKKSVPKKLDALNNLSQLVDSKLTESFILSPNVLRHPPETKYRDRF